MQATLYRADKSQDSANFSTIRSDFNNKLFTADKVTYNLYKSYPDLPVEITCMSTGYPVISDQLFTNEIAFRIKNIFLNKSKKFITTIFQSKSSN